MRNPLHPFEIALKPSPDEEPEFLRAAADKDQAMTLFADTLQRLKVQGAVGELVIIDRTSGEVIHRLHLL